MIRLVSDSAPSVDPAVLSRAQVPRLAAAASSCLPESTHFDGLVHARFSFDRGASQRMQTAVEAVAQQQVDEAACWLPPEHWEAPAGDGSHEADSSSGSSAALGTAGSEAAAGAAAAAAAQGSDGAISDGVMQRLKQLQPDAGAVAAVAATLKERGKQRLNAEQRSAVAAVVCGAGRAYPYALFGPPGKCGSVPAPAGSICHGLLPGAGTMRLCSHGTCTGRCSAVDP